MIILGVLSVFFTNRFCWKELTGDKIPLELRVINLLSSGQGFLLC